MTEERMYPGMSPEEKTTFSPYSAFEVPADLRELHAHLRGAGTSSDFCQCVVEHSKGGDVAGLREKWGGRDKVLVSYPLRDFVPCVLTRKADVPSGKTTTLRLGVGHDSRGDWTLVVKANGVDHIVSLRGDLGVPPGGS